jgi:hypothetical protein
MSGNYKSMKLSIQVECERCGHFRFEDMPACGCVAGQGPFTTTGDIYRETH